MLKKVSHQSQILVFGLFLILGLWLFVWRQIEYEYQSAVADSSREGMNLARVYEDNLRKELQDVDLDLLALRDAYQQEGFNPRASLLVRRIRANSYRTQLGIIDEHGRLHSLLRENTAPYDVSDREYFKNMRDSAKDVMYIGKAVLGRQSQQWGIPICRRITKPDGSFGGGVVIGIDPAYFTESFSRIDLGPEKSISIAGLDGISRIRQNANLTNPGLRLDGRSRVYENAKRVLTGTMLAASANDGIMRIHSFRVLPEYPLYINVAIAQQDILQEVNQRKYGYLAAAALVSLVIIGFCWMLIRNNAKQGQLQQKIAQEASQRKAFQEITSRLVTDFKDMDGLLETIVRDAPRLIGANHGGIAMVDKNGSTWTIRHQTGAMAGYINLQQPLQDGIVGEVISSGKMVYVSDYAIYPRRVKNSPVEAKGVLALPLIIEGQVAGVLIASWVQVMPKPNEDVLKIMGQYAHLASIALERARIQDEFQMLAYTDSLTGLPNRFSVYNRLQEEMDKARGGKESCAVLFIDLDNLKLVNDTLGHSYGDKLIIGASRLIASNAGEKAFVGRLAGDEFVAVLPGLADRQAIADIAGQLIDALHQHYVWDKSPVHVTASIGVAIFPKDGSTVEEILKNADTALYVAKSKGKQLCQFYDAAIGQEMRDNIVLANNLQQALGQGEFLLHYQPVMSAQGSLVGFEALLRWASPQHGLVLPGRFIPVAEQQRLMPEIGAWVLGEACRFAGKLTALGNNNLLVAVNISIQQLECDDFSNTVVSAIQTAGIEASQLCLEITESMLMESVDHNITNLQQLGALGVKFSLDDFGEGYSSLTKLLELPLNSIKISRTFINLLEVDAQRINVIASLVDIAHSLGLVVVAEGVETRTQFMQVTGCRCDLIQGYYFHRPMPVEAALALVSGQIVQDKAEGN